MQKILLSLFVVASLFASVSIAISQTKPKAKPTPAASSRNVGTASVKLRWSGHPEISRYRIQMARDEQFADIAVDNVVVGRETVVTNLAPGRYFWRVAPAVEETGTFSAGKMIEARAGVVNESLIGEPRAQTPSASTTGWRTTTGYVQKPLAAHLRSTSSYDFVGVNSEGTVYALDGSRGLALWTARFRPNAQRGEAAGNGGAPTFTPVIFNSQQGLANVLVAFDGGVRALEGTTGRELWRTALNEKVKCGVAVDSEQAGKGELVVVEGGGKTLLFLNAEDGRILKRSKLGSEIVGAPVPFVLQSVRGIAVAQKDGTVEVLGEDGERTQAAKISKGFTTAPLFVEGPYLALILVGMDGGLVAFSASDLKSVGRIDFPNDSPRGTLSATDLDGDGSPEIVAVTESGHVLVISTVTGKVVWLAEGATDADSATFADLDGDGILDVLVAAGQKFAQGFSGRDGKLLWTADDASQRNAGVATQTDARSLVIGKSGSASFLVGSDSTNTGLRAVELPRLGQRAASY